MFICCLFGWWGTDVDFSAEEAKCIVSRMTTFYKVIHGGTALQLPEYVSTNSRALRGQHTSQNTELFRMSYFPRTIRYWNILSCQLIAQETVDGFHSEIQSMMQSGLLYVVQPKGSVGRPHLGGSTTLPHALY